MGAAVRIAELQDTLRALGLDPGPTDNLYGSLTEDAVFDALNKWAPPVTLVDEGGIVPISWMPECEMERVVAHWTGGAYTANSDDVAHYHILIQGDGSLVRGSYSIKDNEDCSDGRYAGHTKNLNTGSIGVSVCAMAGAIENPFDPGSYPLKEVQWYTLASVVAELCQFYGIDVAPETVLSHAEVQGTLGVAQSGKWDYTRLPFDWELEGATACGNALREDVTIVMLEGGTAKVATASTPSPEVIP